MFKKIKNKFAAGHLKSPLQKPIFVYPLIYNGQTNGKILQDLQ